MDGESIELLMKELRKYGHSPYVMLTRDGFVARLGRSGSFLSFRSETAAGALEGLLKMVREDKEER